MSKKVNSAAEQQAAADIVRNAIAYARALGITGREIEGLTKTALQEIGTKARALRDRYDTGNPYIKRTMHLSILHLDRESQDYVGGITGYAAPIECGAFSHATPEPQKGDEMPDALRNVLAFARSLGCRFVVFEDDEDTHDGLPVFE